MQTITIIFASLGLLACIILGLGLVWPFFVYFQNIHLQRFVKKYTTNQQKSAVIILGYPNFKNLAAWKKPNFLVSELKGIIKELDLRKIDFAIYPRATISQVKNIMQTHETREVFFCGHGDSHGFQLNTDYVIYYCDFADIAKYKKEYVHQVHCGTPYGKTLISCIVPEENRSKCFFFPKAINAKDIDKEFKRRRGAIK